MKRNLIILILILSVLLSVSCNGSRRQEREEQAARTIEMIGKSVYAQGTGFHATCNLLDARLTWLTQYQDISLNQFHNGEEAIVELVFVHFEEDAAKFPYDTIVAWPTAASQIVLDIKNQHISETRFDLEPFSLAYPLTMEDLVDNWADVNELFFALPREIRHAIARALDP
jgi:hypothetical protein